MIKSASVRLTLCLFLGLRLPIGNLAQEEARAVWQVGNFDITVNSLGAERALNARAVLTLRNIGRGSGSTLTLRINSKTEIKSVTVGSAMANYRSLPEPRGGAQRLTITLPSSIAANESVVATVEYRLPVEENSGLAAISPVSSQFLPLSLWYPTANTAFAVRGADYAPFRLTVNGANAISSGFEKGAGGNSVFEQTLNAQPFFVVGNWDRVDGSGTAKDIAAFLPKGSGEDERKQAESLIGLASEARAFYAGIFGPAPDIPVRLVASKRGAGFDDAGTMLIGEGAFRRKRVDAVTTLGIAEAVARLWIGGDTPVRGEGHGVIREGLARFYATLFLEKQFGADVASEERARERLAYAAIAKRDAPLSRTTPLEPTYFNSVSNKGAMVWRLLDNLIGHESFTAVVRGLLTSGKTDAEGFSLSRSRTVLAERGGSTIKNVLDQEMDQPTDMDLMVGLPQQQGGQWTAALRNTGSFEARVSAAAITASGQRLTANATIPPHDFGQVTFQGASNLVRVEVDPEKFYPQTDYTNDAAPRLLEVSASLAEAMRLFGTQEFAKAEALARQMLSATPRMQEARILLARALLSQNKIDESEREFRQLTEERLPTPATLAWSAIGLGEIAQRRGQSKDAARFFSEGVRADAEYASTLTARAARIRAEATTAPSAIDESVRNFIGQLDAAIRTGRQTEIAPLVVTGELSKFIRGAVGTQPEIWQTRVLRTEQLDANQLAVDVAMQTKQLGVEHSGTALLILARVGGAWKLNAIEFFEVR
jgi:tetratricopeptide (TPR) repeat protein